ncbi:VanZ family protein [Megalodesulfovibrio paquesii]
MEAALFLTDRGAKVLRLAWLASMALVTVLSLLPDVGPPAVFDHADLAAHLIAYGWLAFLPRLALREGDRAWAWRMLLLGLGLELLQGLTPYRSLSALDMAANTTGVALGVWLGGWSRTRLPLT